MEQQIYIYQTEKEPNTACLWKMLYITTITMERKGKLDQNKRYIHFLRFDLRIKYDKRR